MLALPVTVIALALAAGTGTLALPGGVAPVGAGAAGVVAQVPQGPPRATPGGMPPGLTRGQRAQLAAMVAPTALEWRPQGTVVADSGFRPATDGFGFFNYGSSGRDLPNLANTYLYGSPTAAGDLDAPALAELFGAAVCQYGHQDCELTLAARNWLAAANSAMASGHGWGMAVTAAQLYGRSSRLPAGAATTGQRRLDAGLARRIALAQASQFVLDPKPYRIGPAELVATLRAQLRAGITPAVLVVGAPAQRTLLPYALYDRGAGHYDIAVYDSDFPGRERALHVDTVAGAFEYELFPAPQRQVVSTGLALVPLSALGGLRCPFAAAAPAREGPVTVQVRQDTGVQAAITGPAGLALLAAVPVVGDTDWHRVRHQSAGTWLVAAGQAFELQVSAPGATGPVTTSVLVSAGGYQWQIDSLTLLPGSPQVIAVDPRRGAIASPATGLDYEVTAALGAGEVDAELVADPWMPLAASVDPSSAQLTIGNPSAQVATVSGEARTQPGKGADLRAMTYRLQVGPDQHLVMDFSGWGRGDSGEVVFVVPRGAGLRPI